MSKIKCPYCEKEYSIKGIGTHIWRTHGEGKNHNPNVGYEKDRVVWNKGLNKENDERVKSMSISSIGRISSFSGKQHSLNSRDKMSASAIKSFEVGNHASWKTRNIQSYPEHYFTIVLKRENLYDECIPEYFIKHNKHSNYFLDFYFPDKKIDLEIDGSQHKFRVKTDMERDIFLRMNSIDVFRIEWKSPKTIEGREYLEKKIKEFIEFYNTQ